MRLTLCALMSLVALTGGSAAQAQTAARFRTIDTWTGSASDLVVASGISADGRVVVGNVFTDQGQRAFRWTVVDGTEYIGAFANPGSQQQSAALAASADGSVIVGGSTLPTSLNEQGSPFRWTQSGGPVFLGSLGGTDGGIARAVSADGSVIAGYGSNANFESEAFRWTQAGGVLGLGGILSSGYTSTATGTSADGATVVGTSSSGFTFVGFRWTLETGLQSASPVGLWFSAVSGDASTIVGLQGSVLTRACVLRDGVLMQIPRIAELGLNDSDGALAVNGDGSVVVGYGNRELDSNVSEQAFVWDAFNGTRSIQSVLTTQFGVDLTGWSLKEATAISADGRTIAGWGYGPPGQTRQLSWVVRFGDDTQGVCCAASGACTVTTSTACDGNWSAGGSCGSGLCPVVAPAMGPCCSLGLCVVSTSAGCEGGVWSRGGTCDPSPCQPAVAMGTCCNTFSTDCEVTTQDGCFGDWTPDATCTPTTCPGPPGACCAADHTCTEGFAASCTGTFHNFASCESDPCNPPPSGACCASQTSTNCAVRTQATCASGIWIEGASCSPSPCGPLGACCASAGCGVVRRGQCAAGVPFFTGGTCQPSPCAPPMHVCCRGTTCAVLADADCVGDSFSPAHVNSGIGTSCSSTAGFDSGCCAADYDHGGVVAVADIFAYLNAWFAGSPYADTNGNGVLEVADIFDLLNAWFAGCE